LVRGDGPWFVPRLAAGYITLVAPVGRLMPTLIRRRFSSRASDAPIDTAPAGVSDAIVRAPRRRAAAL